MAKRSRASRGGLKDIETTKLLAELDRRRAVLTEERAELVALVEEIDEHLAALGEQRPPATRRPSRTTKKRRRTRSDGGSLADTLHTVLRGKKMSVAKAADAVLASGYATKSSAKNFRVIVNQTLTKDRRFKRVSRGVYTAK